MKRKFNSCIFNEFFIYFRNITIWICENSNNNNNNNNNVGGRNAQGSPASLTGVWSCSLTQWVAKTRPLESVLFPISASRDFFTSCHVLKINFQQTKNRHKFFKNGKKHIYKYLKTGLVIYKKMLKAFPLWTRKGKMSVMTISSKHLLVIYHVTGKKYRRKSIRTRRKEGRGEEVNYLQINVIINVDKVFEFKKKCI